MKTIIHIETTDEERRLLQTYLERNSKTKKLISRNDLKDLVTQHVSDLIHRADNKEFDEEPNASSNLPNETQASETDRDEQPSEHEKIPVNRNPGAGFVPSRGDEPYLYKPKDPHLKDRLSALLDDLKQMEDYVWNKLEENREQ